MSSIVTRLAAVAAVATMGVAVPVAAARAASPPARIAGLPGLPGLPPFAVPETGLAGLPAFDAVPLSFAVPAVGQIAAVIGPTIITTAPSTFVNTNNQVSAGGTVSGGQAAG